MSKRRKLTRMIGLICLSIGLLVTTGIIYITALLPAIPVEHLKIAATPARVERGRYLFNNLAGCRDCHSVRIQHLFAMPVQDGTDGQGGEVFDEKEGFPGTYTAKNLTPYHLANWSDGEIVRAITNGVSKDGHALFPLMPYLHFGKADQEDIYSIVAYLRTLPPIKTDPPAGHSNFPMSVIIHTIPAKPAFHSMPNRKDTIACGAYLVNMASCITCHSQENKGKLVAGMEFGGGRKFLLPSGGTLVSANITPENETGIGSWTKNAFIQRFRSYADSLFKPAEVKPGSFNTVMPWTQFGQLSTADLSSIYDYLRTVKPIKNKVVKFINQ